MMNVIDSKNLERDAGGKPVAAFPHPALALAIAAAALGLVAIFVADSPARSQESASQKNVSKAKAPLAAPAPPRRPAELGAPSAGRIAPQPRLSPSEPTETPAASGVAEAPPHPLPAASRERMHACGAEWRDMKASGAATDKTWREFAQVCLAH